MQKLLISAALVTGLIAPAIYATVSYNEAAKTEKRQTVMTSSGKTLSGSTVRNTEKLGCVRTVMQSYTTEKREVNTTFKAKLQKAMREALSAVSGEKKLRNEEVRNLKNEYTEALSALREKYSQKQRACSIR